MLMIPSCPSGVSVLRRCGRQWFNDDKSEVWFTVALFGASIPEIVEDVVSVFEEESAVVLVELVPRSSWVDLVFSNESGYHLTTS